MNRGNIPGFYYDEEKKKYFKITASHVAPVNAKYSRTNVKREERDQCDRKKRKLEDCLVRKQTVTQAAPLRNRLLSTTLQREIGYRTAGHLHSSRDEAIIDNLEYTQLVPRIKGYHTCPTIADAHYAVDQERMLFAASHNAGATCVYAYEWEDGVDGVQHLTEQRPLVALPGRFVSMHHFGSTLLLVSNSSHAIQYYLGPSNLADHPQSTLFPSATLKNTVNTAHACAYDPFTQSIAFAGTGLVVVNGIYPGHVGHCDFAETTESFAVTWLQPSVLAYGQQIDTYHRRSHYMAASHSVRLWDVRVGDQPDAANSSTRLNRQHRITGLQKVRTSDHHLLVTSNRDLSLYDLRMQPVEGPPILSLPHTSAGAQLNFAVHGDLVAATDELFQVKVYSLQTNRHLRTLIRGTAANSYAPLLGQLRWQEHRRGSPYLQACADSIVHKWNW